MGRWCLQTFPARLDGELTGHFSDDDRHFRLGILLRTLIAAHAAVAEAQQNWDAEIAACRRDGQGKIADKKLKELAEKLGR